VIGALVGSVMIQTAKKAEALAQQALAATDAGEPDFGEQYRSAVRRLSIVGSLLSTLVLVTILFMVLKP
jgi:uncharacterized membrane protein